MNAPGRSSAGQPRSTSRFTFDRTPATFAGTDSRPSRPASSRARSPDPPASDSGPDRAPAGSDRDFVDVRETGQTGRRESAESRADDHDRVAHEGSLVSGAPDLRQPCLKGPGTCRQATDIDAGTQVPAVVAQPLTDALLGCLPAVLPGRRNLFSWLRPGGT